MGLRTLKQSITEGKPHKAGYSIVNGVVLYKGRLLIPRSSPHITTILSEYHDGVIGGTQGFLKR